MDQTLEGVLTVLVLLNYYCMIACTICQANLVNHCRPATDTCNHSVQIEHWFIRGPVLFRIIWNAKWDEQMTSSVVINACGSPRFVRQVSASESGEKAREVSWLMSLTSKKRYWWMGTVWFQFLRANPDFPSRSLQIRHRVKSGAGPACSISTQSQRSMPSYSQCNHHSSISK